MSVGRLGRGFLNRSLGDKRIAVRRHHYNFAEAASKDNVKHSTDQMCAGQNGCGDPRGEQDSIGAVSSAHDSSPAAVGTGWGDIVGAGVKDSIYEEGNKGSVHQQSEPMVAGR